MTISSGFSLYRRSRKNGKPVYYVQFKNPDGTYQTGKSTGCTTKRDAIKWAESYLAKNGTPAPGRKITFKEYSRDFFAWNGPWARDKRITGRRVSEQHCHEYTRILEKNVNPEIGHLTLTEITKPVLKAYRNMLFYEKGMSGSYTNKALGVIKFVLKAAAEDDLIQYVPYIERVSQRPEKTKGILSIEEARRVLEPSLWDDHRAYVMSLTAASTGMRQGELLGLRVKNFKGAYLEVTQSWNEHLKRLNESTKTGRARNIAIPGPVRDALQGLIDANPWTQEHGGEAFIFFNEVQQDRPTDGKYMAKLFYRAMAMAGIDEEERAARNITFHSWRYFLNSLLINSKIPLQKIQSITGHLTAEMSQHYYAMQVDDMGDVLEITEGLFSIEAPENGGTTEGDTKH